MEMEWYTPLTILPAVALIILSTSNYLVALNNEIYQMEKDESTAVEIIRLKLIQLRRLGIANAMLYASSLCFMISSLAKTIYDAHLLFQILTIAAVLFVTIALCYLFYHSIYAINIRERNLKQ